MMFVYSMDNIYSRHIKKLFSFPLQYCGFLFLVCARVCVCKYIAKTFENCNRLLYF